MDVIIHKLTDLILEADQNDTQSLLLVQRVQVRTGHNTNAVMLLPFFFFLRLAANIFSVLSLSVRGKRREDCLV